jgi:hypothetical protein
MSQEEKHPTTYLHGANLAAGLSPDCQSGGPAEHRKGVKPRPFAGSSMNDWWDRTEPLNPAASTTARGWIGPQSTSVGVAKPSASPSPELSKLASERSL